MTYIQFCHANHAGKCVGEGPLSRDRSLFVPEHLRPNPRAYYNLGYQNG